MSDNNLKTLEKLIDTMAGQQIMVIGDIMLDRFVYGAIDRLSPESDSPVLDIRHEEALPGGAGNVAAALHGLGVTVTLAAVIGNDEAGRTLSALLARLMPDAANGLLTLPDRPTTEKTRFVNADGQLMRADREQRAPLHDDEQARLLAKIEAALPGCAAVILSDYHKGVLTPALIRAVINKARATNVPVLADPKQPDAALYDGAFLLTPNRAELADLTGKTAHTDEDIAAAATQLLAAHDFACIVVTRSEDGISVFARDNPEPVHIRHDTPPAVTDVAGAGDVAIATLAAALAAGAAVAEAAALANRACAQAVTQPGTCRIDAAALRGALAGPVRVSVPAPEHDAYICGWDDAAAQVKAWQAQGLRIGFTNGCFDILHYGHVTYLNRARTRCDKLVLGLNHDASIRLLKGPDRPVHDEQARAAVIGALGAVDMVVLFGAEAAGEDNTPCALLERLKPDLFFKGGDYTLDQLPEAKVMAAHGGTVDIMPLYDGHSTTASIARMRRQTG